MQVLIQDSLFNSYAVFLFVNQRFACSVYFIVVIIIVIVAYLVSDT